MSTTITGKLNKAASQFQAGDSTGFSVRLGVKYRDPKTKQDEWTNYQAVIFAKAPAQIQFYQNALIEGAVIEVTCEQLKIDSYEGTNGTMLSIDMLNARLGYVFSGTQQPAQQQAAPQHVQMHPSQVPAQSVHQAPQYNQQVPQQQYAPQQSPMAQNPNNSDTSIPF